MSAGAEPAVSVETGPEPMPEDPAPELDRASGQAAQAYDLQLIPARSTGDGKTTPDPSTEAEPVRDVSGECGGATADAAAPEPENMTEMAAESADPTDGDGAPDLTADMAPLDEETSGDTGVAISSEEPEPVSFDSGAEAGSQDQETLPAEGATEAGAQDAEDTAVTGPTLKTAPVSAEETWSADAATDLIEARLLALEVQATDGPVRDAAGLLLDQRLEPLIAKYLDQVHVSSSEMPPALEPVLREVVSTLQRLQVGLVPDETAHEDRQAVRHMVARFLQRIEDHVTHLAPSCADLVVARVSEMLAAQPDPVADGLDARFDALDGQIRSLAKGMVTLHDAQKLNRFDHAIVTRLFADTLGPRHRRLETRLASIDKRLDDMAAQLSTRPAAQTNAEALGPILDRLDSLQAALTALTPAEGRAAPPTQEDASVSPDLEEMRALQRSMRNFWLAVEKTQERLDGALARLESAVQRPDGPDLSHQSMLRDIGAGLVAAAGQHAGATNAIKRAVAEQIARGEMPDGDSEK